MADKDNEVRDQPENEGNQIDRFLRAAKDLAENYTPTGIFVKRSQQAKKNVAAKTER